MRAFLITAVIVTAGCSSPRATPVIETVTPSVVDTRDDTTLVITGQHLEPRVTLDLDKPSNSSVDQTFIATLVGPEQVELTSLRWVTPSRLAAVLPNGAAPGLYTLHVTDPSGVEALLNGAVEVVGEGTVLPDGGVLPTDAGSVPCDTLTWADNDFDGYGAGLPSRRCGFRRVRNASDCNDFDPMISPAGLELCNGLDDDCDGPTDEGVCPPDAGWTRRTDTGSADWASAWSGARGAIVIAGKSDVRVRRAASSFVAATGCPSNLLASWQATGGRSFVAGGSGNNGQGRASEVAAVCADVKQLGEPVVGIVGFEADGGLELVGALRSGSLVRWSPGSPVVETPGRVQNARLEDLHAVDPESLYAVGSDTEDQPHMRVFHWTAAGWFDQQISSLPGDQRGSLHAVWVLDPGTVFVGGDNGLVAMLRWRRWTKLGSLDAGVRSVRAFGVARVYAALTNGQVVRWNGERWDVVYDNRAQVPWADLAGTGEDDLWVVGAQGLVAHWPD